MPRVKLTPHARRLLVERVVTAQRSLTEAAEAAGVSERWARRLVDRYRRGDHGLEDGSSVPLAPAHKTPADREAEIVRLRVAHRYSGQQIATVLGMPRSTVGAVLRRRRLGRLPRPGPVEPPNRYDWPEPGQMVHIDVKKLGRFDRPGHRIHGDRTQHSRRVGWEFLYVCVDAATRLAYAELLANEQGPTAVGFLRRAHAWFATRQVTVDRVLTDNGSPFVSHAWAAACADLGVRHRRTRPYRPRTNGKAERFIGLITTGWAYGRSYETSTDRARWLPSWLHWYNLHRPHGSLNGQTPRACWRTLLGNNLASNYS